MMRAALFPGEQPVKDGRANLQRGLETVGGKLYLTTSRLIFEAHKLNIQTQDQVIERSAITVVEPTWTKFLGKLPVLPNSIAVSTTEGTFSFVVSGRHSWISAITGG